MTSLCKLGQHIIRSTVNSLYAKAVVSSVASSGQGCFVTANLGVYIGNTCITYYSDNLPFCCLSLCCCLPGRVKGDFFLLLLGLEGNLACAIESRPIGYAWRFDRSYSLRFEGTLQI